MYRHVQYYGKHTCTHAMLHQYVVDLESGGVVVLEVELSGREREGPQNKHITRLGIYMGGIDKLKKKMFSQSQYGIQC